MDILEKIEQVNFGSSPEKVDSRISNLNKIALDIYNDTTKIKKHSTKEQLVAEVGALSGIIKTIEYSIKRLKEGN